ncbi:hypothetical protein [Persephonella sp.]
MNLKNKVEKILKEFPETRNSDISLTIQIWRTFYPEFLETDKLGRELVCLDALFELPREDIVKRYRAKFNEEGLYLPTDEEVLRQRHLKEKQFRKELGYEA